MKIELSHDVLALKVGEKITGEEKELRSVENFLKKREEEFKERGKPALLGKDDLDYITPYLKRLSLDKDVIRFIQLSKNQLRKRTISLAVFAIVISCIILTFSAISFRNYQIVIQEKEKIEQASGDLDKKEQKLLGINQALETKKREATDSEKEVDTLNKKLSENKRKIAILDSEYIQKVRQIENAIKRFRSEGNKEEAFADPMRWSKDLGEMNWEAAKGKCSELGNGFKLPTRKDWLAIYNSPQELVTTWKSEGSIWYWTRDEKTSTEAFGFLLDQGVTHFDDKNVKWHVKCVR